MKEEKEMGGGALGGARQSGDFAAWRSGDTAAGAGGWGGVNTCASPHKVLPESLRCRLNQLLEEGGCRGLKARQQKGELTRRAPSRGESLRPSLTLSPSERRGRGAGLARRAARGPQRERAREMTSGLGLRSFASLLLPNEGVTALVMMITWSS